MKYISQVEETGRLRRWLTRKKYKVYVETASFFIRDIEIFYFEDLSLAEAFRLDFFSIYGDNSERV